MSEQESTGEKMAPGKIHISIDELSAKQRKAILGLIKDMGFAEGEVAEVVVAVHGPRKETVGEKNESAKQPI